MVKGDREAFYAHELEVRAEGGLPPFGRLAALIVSANEHDDAMGFARKLLSAAPHGRGPAAFRPGRRARCHGAGPAPRPAAGAKPARTSTSRAMSASGSPRRAAERATCGSRSTSIRRASSKDPPTIVSASTSGARVATGGRALHVLVTGDSAALNIVGLVFRPQLEPHRLPARQSPFTPQVLIAIAVTGHGWLWAAASISASTTRSSALWSSDAREQGAATGPSYFMTAMPELERLIARRRAQCRTGNGVVKARPRRLVTSSCFKLYERGGTHRCWSRTI